MWLSLRRESILDGQTSTVDWTQKPPSVSKQLMSLGLSSAFLRSVNVTDCRDAKKQTLFDLVLSCKIDHFQVEISMIPFHCMLALSE